MEYGLAPLSASDELRAAVIALADERYASRAWTWGDGRERDIRKERRFEGAGRVEARMNLVEGAIRDVVFFGDFFGAEDLEPVARALEGLPPDRASVAQALAPIEIGRFFYRIGKEEFIDFLCS